VELQDRITSTQDYLRNIQCCDWSTLAAYGPTFAIQSATDCRTPAYSRM